MISAERKTDAARKEYKDVEFQQRVELGEIRNALQGFAERRYDRTHEWGRNLWATIVRGQENELQRLVSEEAAYKRLSELAELEEKKEAEDKVKRLKRKKCNKPPTSRPEIRFTRKCRCHKDLSQGESTGGAESDGTAAAKSGEGETDVN